MTSVSVHRNDNGTPYWWLAMQAQSCRCYWCGVSLSYERARTHEKGITHREQRKKTNRHWTCEHFLPGDVAPKNDPYYIVLACLPCNSRKGGALPSLIELVQFACWREATEHWRQA